MELSIQKTHNYFVAEIDGLDLKHPLSTLQSVDLNHALDEFGVLIFRNQILTDQEQIEFSKTFGPIELAVGGTVRKEKDRRLSIEIADVSNLDKDGNIFARGDRRRMFNLGNRLWHSDSSYRRIPAKCSLLSCHINPSVGGNTEFAFMPAAYEALDDEIKNDIDKLVAEHSLIYSRGQLGFSEFSDSEREMFKPVWQALVRKNGYTGRKSIYLSAHIGTIVGWEIPEARDFIRELMEHATAQDFIYAHEWSVGDLIVWDNRQCMHRVRPFKDTGEPRDMRRTTVAGESETTPQID
jgi:alpha-ketoglutarate-dependent 2,4-dichlorophenoxyacetate dioxygenase